MSKITVTFKKLLGNGRAWRTPTGFTAELLEVMASPLEDIKNRLSSLKFVHFPTTLVDKNNIENGEELFRIQNSGNKTLQERAADVEAQWRIFSGFQNYKQLEKILQQKGLPVVVAEDLPESYIYGEKAIGNGELHIGNEVYDPVIISDLDNVIFVSALDFLTPEQVKSLVDTVVKCRQAHLAAYYLPRFLRKKEIHHVLTKNEMQRIFKKQYCNVGVG